MQVNNILKNIQDKFSSKSPKLENETNLQGFEIVDGLTIKEDKKINYEVNGNVYIKLLEVWNKNLIPVLKVKYYHSNTKFEYIYLNCSKQRWNCLWNSYSNTAVLKSFITENFITNSFKDARIVIRPANIVYFLTGNKYNMIQTKRVNTIIEEDEECDESSES